MRDITLGDTIYIRFTTRAFATGVPTTLAGTPVLSIYEENNLVQITAGVSVTADYDSVTGLNQATIVATSGNGYESGKSYDLVITTGTVSSVSVVGEVVGSFTVESSSAFIRLGSPASASIAADLVAIDNFVDGIETAVITNAAGVDISADIAAAKVDTAAILVDTGTTIPGTIITLQSDTDNIQTRIPAALVGGVMDSNVSAISSDTTAATNLSKSALGISSGLCSGTPTTTTIATDLTDTTNETYTGRVIIMTSGNAKNEATDITAYDGTTKTLTVTALATAPAANDTFVIV